MHLPDIAARVFGTPLMIARVKLEVILGVLAPRFAGGLVEPVGPTTDPAPLTSISAEQIAVVSLIGTLVSRSGYLDAASGLLSYDEISDAVTSAMDDPAVRGVILDIDSWARCDSGSCPNGMNMMLVSRNGCQHRQQHQNLHFQLFKRLQWMPGHSHDRNRHTR